MIDKQLDMMGQIDSIGLSPSFDKGFSDNFDKLNYSLDSMGSDVVSSIADGYRKLKEDTFSISQGINNFVSVGGGLSEGILGINDGLQSLRDLMWQDLWPYTRINRLRRRRELQDLQDSRGVIEGISYSISNLESTIEDVESNNLKFTERFNKDYLETMKEKLTDLYDIGKSRINQALGFDRKDKVNLDKRNDEEDEILTKGFYGVKKEVCDGLEDLNSNINDNFDRSIEESKEVELGFDSMTGIAGMFMAHASSVGDKIKESVSETEEVFKSASEMLMLTLGKTFEEALEMKVDMVDVGKQMSESLNDDYLLGLKRYPIELAVLEESISQAVSTGAVNADTLRGLVHVYSHIRTLMPKVDPSQYDYITRAVDHMEDGADRMVQLAVIMKEYSLEYYVDSATLVKVADDYHYFVRALSRDSDDYIKNMKNVIATTAILEDSFLDATAVMKDMYATAWKPLSQISAQEYMKFNLMGVDMQEYRRLGQEGNFTEQSSLFVDGMVRAGITSGLLDASGEMTKDQAQRDRAIEMLVAHGFDVNEVLMYAQEGKDFGERADKALDFENDLLNLNEAQERHLEMIAKYTRKSAFQDFNEMRKYFMSTNSFMIKMAENLESIGFSSSNLGIVFSYLLGRGVFSKLGTSITGLLTGALAKLGIGKAAATVAGGGAVAKGGAVAGGGAVAKSGLLAGIASKLGIGAATGGAGLAATAPAWAVPALIAAALAGTYYLGYGAYKTSQAVKNKNEALGREEDMLVRYRKDMEGYLQSGEYSKFIDLHDAGIDIWGQDTLYKDLNLPSDINLDQIRKEADMMRGFDNLVSGVDSGSTVVGDPDTIINILKDQLKELTIISGSIMGIFEYQPKELDLVGDSIVESIKNKPTDTIIDTLSDKGASSVATGVALDVALSKAVTTIGGKVAKWGLLKGVLSKMGIGYALVSGLSSGGLVAGGASTPILPLILSGLLGYGVGNVGTQAYANKMGFDDYDSYLQSKIDTEGSTLNKITDWWAETFYGVTLGNDSQLPTNFSHNNHLAEYGSNIDSGSITDDKDVITILDDTYILLQSRLDKIISLMPESQQKQVNTYERDVPVDQSNVVHQLDLTKNYASNYSRI